MTGDKAKDIDDIDKEKGKNQYFDKEKFIISKDEDIDKEKGFSDILSPTTSTSTDD